MKIGLIGAGSVSQAFARKAIDAGHSVMISNSSGPESLQTIVDQLGVNATAVTKQEVAENEVVLLGVDWTNVVSALADLSKWDNRILIDATNAFDETSNNGLADLGGKTSSQIVAELAIGARVVKAMNTTFMSNFSSNPKVGEMRRVLFICGDDSDAKNTVASLFESFGFAPIDLGNLKRGSLIQGIGAPIAGHDFFVPWPAPRSFPFGTSTGD